MTSKRSIGIRELRQNASRYVARAEQGETIEVTSRGRSVALLTPLPGRATARERLISEGKLTPAHGLLTDLGPPEPAVVTGSASAVLEDQRQDRSFD